MLERYIDEWLEKGHREVCSILYKLQQVQVEHQTPDGIIHVIDVPTWKWDEINMDIVFRFLAFRGKMTKFLL